MIKVLFVAADPSEKRSLAISEEARAIGERIRIGAARSVIEIVQEWAVTPSDLQRALLFHRPNIVHFSAHGSSTHEIILENEAGGFIRVSSTALGRLFNILKDNIAVVILEECYSQSQAKAIVDSVGCVIGIPIGLPSRGSIVFCSYFYTSLAFGRTIRESFDLAVNSINLEGLEGKPPQLFLSPRFDSTSSRLVEAPNSHLSIRDARAGLSVGVLNRNLFASLDFGAPAAERDISKGLIDYFVESQAFRRIYSGGRFVLLGNRGVGKSAVFRIIAEREEQAGTQVIELRPDDFSYELLDTMMPPGRDGQWVKQGAYTAAWKYLIYVLIMKALTEKGRNLKRGAAGRIYSYLRDNHKGFQRNPIALLLSYLSRMEGIKIGSYEAALKSTELVKLYKLEEISQLMPDIAELCATQKVLVLIDELDRGWNDSEDAKAFVAGLFQAVISINQLTPRLRVLLSLRMELYDSIPSVYDDVQKYRDVMEIISWDEKSLLQLVAKRIRHTVPALATKTDTECWNTVFAETLDYKKTKSYNYFIDRTLYRPREIIQFCTDVLELSRETQSWPIDYSVICEAEVRYSRGRTDDIVGEYRFQYPGLNEVFEVFRGQSYNLSKAGLEALCAAISEGEYGLSESAIWAQAQQPHHLIEVLWKIGFLRAQSRVLRRLSRSSYLGPHQVSNLNLRKISRFQVHAMFRSSLGMREGRQQPLPKAKAD